MDRPGTGPHQGVALREAHYIAMPIMPGALLSVGPVAAIVDMSDDVVNTYNNWQWSGHRTWVAAKPGTSGDLWLGQATHAA